MATESIYDQIVQYYPELLDDNEVFIDGTITLRNDSDGVGDYIEAWNYEKPLPPGLHVGKPA
jgi:hypothetical protein